MKVNPYTTAVAFFKPGSSILLLGFAMSMFWFQAVGQADDRRQTLQFADPIKDNMVVQQNKPFKVWGKAPEKALVKIEADWLKGSVTVQADERGNFLGILDVPKVEPGDFRRRSITISTEQGVKVSVNNVLIGELWFFGGQSNMQFPVKEVLNGAEQVAQASFSNIRLFDASLNFSNSTVDSVGGTWVECSPQSVGKFSAVAYFFACTLYKRLNLPVGVIFSGIGASAAQAWVAKDVLAADCVLDSIYLQPYLNSERSKEIVDGGFSFEKVTRPYLLYNAMIYPFRNLSIKGFCWYQGESNRNERDSYTRLMHALINSWRSVFGQGELPFYYVQVAPFYWDQDDPQLADYAFFREVQEHIRELNNTEMVTTMDVGESRDLHPKNKKPIGVRLGNVALNRTYAHLDIPYKGPEMRYVLFEGDTAVVVYDSESVRGGLRTNDGQRPKHFFLAGDDGKFFEADAFIQDNRVKVYSAKVKQPVALRYAFTNFPITNLENGSGIPAIPFRTDSWPESK